MRALGRQIFFMVGWVALGSAATVRAGTYTVLPDGTGDFATIQEAVDAADEGSVIELGSGVFGGDGNRDVTVSHKNVTIRSLAGDPEQCVIDCAGDHSGIIYFGVDIGRESLLEGVTIRGARVVEQSIGGAIVVHLGHPTIRNCVLTDCEAPRGGGVAIDEGGPLIDSCLIVGNRADFGGGIWVSQSVPSLEIRSTTIAGNRAEKGGGLYIRLASVVVDRSIIWGNCASDQGAEAYLSTAASFSMSCGIVDADGVHEIEIPSSILYDPSTTFEDPRFCDPASCAGAPTTMGLYTLDQTSPAASSNSECGELIGARAVGCSVIPVSTTTWSSVKRRFSPQAR